MTKALTDYVMVIDDALPERLTCTLLEEYLDSDEWMGTPEKLGGSPDGGYPASVVLITHPKVTNKSALRQEISRNVVKYLGNAFDKFHAKFSRREQGLNFLHIESLVGLRLLRYETGQYMVNHTDKYPDSDSNQVSWPAVTFTVNLNDNFTGGELKLLDGDIIFKAKARQGIFFPSNFMYPHAVEKVTSGTRYALAGWFR